ncbi:rho GDP-dissociation inhibitor 3 isoform X1 [Canis lupus baileyi]|uniref:rho GDP-dissociation inhibitor 3 isoform X1 n=1 Tax=Canis lupus familiaris TaxID=9615 RepID=UPI0003ADA260|nr:rho GDP-dissociation inhibitor 3 isoform X1 [Canis lupus familiaris]XP_025273005.1 rho GDP-dissociation inhibitor 3 isoform X1 [Canis lupus dingo]XP_038396895.1 rho GDP-dissociation inhibitor 3 isoform X1 [Canis lupus familiaris]XP_038525695.1 rho GDP-dissociation inhibitor 3 isoform X1 [Canis lupus familiaris]|eukprot:XP_005621817.1 rho GDP-dissociation inhibitor 3 isoform X1 [Canis lupus familiaris]
MRKKRASGWGSPSSTQTLISLSQPEAGAALLPALGPPSAHPKVSLALRPETPSGLHPQDSALVLLTDKEGRQLPPDEALDEAVPEYRAPGRKSLQELQQLDPEDESLAKYKQTLLGPLPPVVDESLPNVQVTRLTLMSEQAPGPITMDLTGELAALQGQVFVLKEGVDYKVKITFKVNREIVSGLKCVHHTYRQGLRVDKAVYMVGSYGPRAQEYEFVTPVEEAPRGALVRGAYVVTSFFTDDDRTDHLSWEWGLHICQDWKS